MTNIERATEHLDSLDSLFDRADGTEPNNAQRAQALADGGYLTPNLPEPRTMKPIRTTFAVMAGWEADGYHIWATRSDCPSVTYDEDTILPPSEARARGLALIAAANWAEEQEQP